MQYGLKKETIEKINRIFKQHEKVETAVLYGSRAMGNYKPELTLKGLKQGMQQGIILKAKEPFWVMEKNCDCTLKNSETPITNIHKTPCLFHST